MTLAALAPTPVRGLARTRLDPQLAAFLNWLACWVVLPNLPFLPITLMGGPPRLYDFLACGIVGLVARRFPYALRALVFIGLMAWLVTGFIASMFNMGIGMIMSVAPLVFDMSPATSPEYMLGAGLLLGASGLALWLLRQPGTFDRPRYLVLAVGITVALAAISRRRP